MRQEDSIAGWAPLPTLRGLVARPFGLVPEDLDVDFDGERASLTTALLTRCTRDASGGALDDARWWSQSIGYRLRALLALATLGDAHSFVVEPSCRRAECRESMETELTAEELLAYGAEAEAGALVVPIEGHTLRLRLPTGADQRRWAERQEVPPADTLLRELVEDGDRALLPSEIPPEWLAAAEGALALADPLVDFRLITSCPACGAEDQFEVDVQRLALDRLWRAQERLLDGVHRMALAYHWNEREILALTPRRRAQYLMRLDEVGR